jgi:AraC-like DNA-binding protein
MSILTIEVFIMDEVRLPDVKILCCNYFRGVDVWDYENVNRAYWRFYWNESPGAFLHFKGHEIALTPDIFVLIPPYTNFSTYCKHKFNHLYLHFIAGEPFDMVKRKILTFDAVKTLRADIKTIKEQLLCLKQSQQKESMLIYSLIFDALLKINDSDFSEKPSLDTRIKLATDLMHEHFSKVLSNQEICDRIHMSQTNFIRLFRQELGIPPQKYLGIIRIEKATYMLCYTCRRIEEIAEMTGFTDRYHFSRVFKQTKGTSPAAYRKQMTQVQR